MQRLSERSLPSLGHRPRPGIVHFGIGAFFRAHGAIYSEEAMAAAGGHWGIVGVSLRSPALRDQLAPQDFLYTAMQRHPVEGSFRTISALRNVLVAPENPDAVLATLDNPDIHIVTLTVTEKGYCHDPATGSLNTQHPDIVHDLQNPRAPKTVIGFLSEALARRRDAGAPALTLLSCDNLSGNGRVLANLVQQFAEHNDRDLAKWIGDNTRFPCSMVDRIVPATTDQDRADVAAGTGFADEAPVVHEPFRQWVIEDKFVNARPAWDIAGAQFTGDVQPFEDMKLRLLNASHSALAYLGYLAGYETIDKAISNPVLKTFVTRLWHDEIIPVMTAPPGMDLASYTRDLVARFSNTAIQHRTWQIAMDGSQKLPPRILKTVRDRLKPGMPIPLLALVVAGWIRYVRGVDERGSPIDVRDPLASALQAGIKPGQSPEMDVDAALAMTAIFGSDLSTHPTFRRAVHDAYGMIATRGLLPAVAEYNQI